VDILESGFVFPPHPPSAARVSGGGWFPVRRVFCIGRNYAEHVRELGGDPKSDPPVFFSKPADAVVPAGSVVPYPPGTENLHYEGELVVALGGGGERLQSRAQAGALIYGHACGCDLTRRDLQAQAKRSGGPWEAAKGFDASAPLGDIVPVSVVTPEHLARASVVLTVDGEQKQHAPLAAMIWTVPEILMALSNLFVLKPGDLVFTGTPEGVGPLLRGSAVCVNIGPLPALEFTVAGS
jgi:fumarylpyruvate hydrolase